MTRPLVSIIIPIHNSEKYLAQCLDSILSQSYKNIEIILVNNNSTDDSAKICKYYQQKDQRIRLTTEKTPGPGMARNAGMKISRGAYIAFVDSDDIITYNHIDNLVTLALKGNADIAITAITPFKTLPPNERISQKTKLLDKQEAINSMLALAFSSGPCGKLYKRSTVDNITFGDFFVAEDLLFNYEAFKNCQIVVINDSVTYGYRDNLSSITKSSFNPKQLDALKVIDIILAEEGQTRDCMVRYFIIAFSIYESICKNKKKPKAKYKQIYAILRELAPIVKRYDKLTRHQRILANLCTINPNIAFCYIRILNILASTKNEIAG